MRVSKCITGRFMVARTGGVARLEGERVDEEVEVDGVATSSTTKSISVKKSRGKAKATHAGFVCASAEKPFAPTRAA